MLSKLYPKSADGMVSVDFVAEDDPMQLVRRLRALGLRNPSVAGRVVSGRFPASRIDAIDRAKGLLFARPALAMTLNGVPPQGEIVSGGDIAQVSAGARATFGVDGGGVRVGVLSDSFNALGGADAGVASGDLPADLIVLSDVTGASDEGRAMAEIVRDVAPGANQAFYSAWNGQADFANGIKALAAIGCKVITDDVIYYFEPMFADGIVAQAVDAAAASGVAYFSSAGNSARQAYEAPFRPDQWGWHNFDPVVGGDVDWVQKIELRDGDAFLFILQWASPYASTSLSSPGSSSDLDIYAVSADGSGPAPQGVYWETGFDANVGRDPIEYLYVEYAQGAGEPESVELGIAINLYEGDAPKLLKYVWYDFGRSGSNPVKEHVTSSGALYGHANAKGAIAVGAARYCQTPAFGVTPTILESFSSAGGTDILFTPGGQPANEARLKPEIVAPDGGNNTFFGDDFDCGPVPGNPPNPSSDGWPNFYGTSAAAPHAAGVAALMLQRVPYATPADIRKALQDSAFDMGPFSLTGQPVIPGFDFDSGFGLIQADGAITELEKVSPPEFSPGDLDHNHCVDKADYDLIRGAVRAHSTEPNFDLNKDGFVNSADARLLVQWFTNPGGTPCSTVGN